jgi:hypothetical protein
MYFERGVRFGETSFDAAAHFFVGAEKDKHANPQGSGQGERQPPLKEAPTEVDELTHLRRLARSMSADNHRATTRVCYTRASAIAPIRGRIVRVAGKIGQVGLGKSCVW